MKHQKIWLISWFSIVVFVFVLMGYWMYRVDPFFHYHAPDTYRYFYVLNNQRSQNDGIIKQFSYNALITGTSMTENFKTSELDELFGCVSIKVPFSGASYKEINDNITKALMNNPDIKLVVRGLDMYNFDQSEQAMRSDLGEYPIYLYDNNPFNDVKYLLNKELAFSIVYPMTCQNNYEDFKVGITSFDDYSCWQNLYSFGINSVVPEGIQINEVEEKHLTEAEKETIETNITKNVTDIADQYPDVDFFYFYTPYSAAWWCDLKNSGMLYRQLEMERFVTDIIVQHKNIHLFSFNNRTDITTDLNNYKDLYHYGNWINSFILKCMHDGNYQLTRDNYKEYLKKEYYFYTTFDYESMNGQVDYVDDYYAGQVLLGK